jgi:vacuolar protein sorting-associated protein 13A/C
MIGYADFLGSPVGLFTNLGTGVKDLFYEPVSGATNGPLSMTKGVLKGTGSFVKNTVEGTFGTVSKLTGSMATGLTMIS